MLVYGDRHELCDPSERIAEIGREIAQVTRRPAGIGRHSRLVSALIEAGRVLQGVEDAGGTADGLNRFVYRIAEAAVRSFDTHFDEVGDPPGLPGEVLPPKVELRVPEGFAFYAVYPEAYIGAARRLRLNGPPRVIGIRSIGTTLGAIVAAALHAAPPVTVRPFGDPFARQVELPPEIIEDRAHYVIVDEGPGLSGSSFGALADWLEQRRVPLERIAFVPSHAGDLGRHASEAHRRRWRRAQRVPAEFNAEFLTERFGPLTTFSTADPWERRKFVATKDGTRVLLKFAGLGQIAERKLEIARRLHAESLVAQPIDLVHGFLVERWVDDARPLAPDARPIPEIARYIIARTRLPPPRPESGATIDGLLTMVRRNASLELGCDATRALDRWQSRARSLQRRVIRVCTDNKLDRGEWLRSRDGALIKTDALDHHCAHDLVGCQDIAWDVAGAIVEFDLDQVSASELVGRVQHSHVRVDSELLDFCMLAYVAFRLGQARLGAQTAPHLTAQAERYSKRLRRLLEHTSEAKQLESLVD